MGWIKRGRNMVGRLKTLYSGFDSQAARTALPTLVVERANQCQQSPCQLLSSLFSAYLNPTVLSVECSISFISCLNPSTYFSGGCGWFPQTAVNYPYRGPGQVFLKAATSLSSRDFNLTFIVTWAPFFMYSSVMESPSSGPTVTAAPAGRGNEQGC